MKKALIVLFIFLFAACSDKKNTKLNIVVTYNNGDIDTFYDIACIDSTVYLTNGDISVIMPGFENRKTIASNVRNFHLIK